MRHITIQTPQDLAPFIDHTILKADATSEMIEQLCREALTFGFYAVCVNGVHVALAKKCLAGRFSSRGTPVLIAAVVGFPLGAMTENSKAFEAAEAVRNGASEIDMVMRIDFAKEKNSSGLRSDVAAVVNAVAGRAIVKVILETGLLSRDEIMESAKIASDAGAHFVKTCTGFSTAGTSAGAATVEHVELMRGSVRADVQIKASGGIKTFETARTLIAAGATRLGTSSGVSLVTDGITATSGY